MSYQAIPHGDIEQDTLLIDIATRNVIRLAPGDSIGEAARIMTAKRISSIVVADENGHPSGIVTEHNMLHAMQSRCPTETALWKVMSSPVITVPASITCLDAYQICLRDGIRHLVIVNEDQRLIGVVSETNFRQHINLSVLAGRRQVASVMSRSVFIQSPETGLMDALNLMEAHRDTCVVAVEAERPVGIVTERDIVRFYSGNPTRTDIPISAVMTSPVLTIAQENSINDAAEQMLAAKVRHLVVVDNQGRMAGLLSEHDLTHTMALRLIDDKLIAEGAFLHTLVATIPDMVWLKDVNGVYRSCNPRVERFFGATEKDIIGKTDYDFVDHELADAFRDHDRVTMERNGPTLNEEWGAYADDGHRELLETLRTPMRDQQGNLIGVLGISRDITERKLAEQALLESEGKLREQKEFLASILESSLDAFMLMNSEGVISDWSSQAEKMFGWKREEAIGRLMYETIVPARYRDRHVHGMKRFLSAGEGSALNTRIELCALHRDGREFPVELSISLIKTADGFEISSFVRDISERKHTEDALYFVAQRGWMNRDENFFDALAHYLGKTLCVDYVFIDRLDEDPSNVETIALYAKGFVVPNLKYSLKDTPCEKVMGRNFCYYPQGIQQLFPEDTLLVEMGIESYAGIPLWDSAGQAIGLIAVMDSKQLPNEALIVQVLKIMATRAAAELERERSNHVLLTREREFRTLAENMPDNVIRYDRQCRVRYANLAVASSIAPAARPVLGKAPVESHPGRADVTDYQRMMERVIATGESSEMEIHVPYPNGETHTHHIRFVAEHDNDGMIAGALAIGRDITERKRMEQQLAERERLFRAIFEQVPNAVELIDPETLRFVEVNPAACRLLGYPHEDYLRLRLIDTQVDFDEAALLAAVRQIEISGGATFENRHRRKNGDILNVEVNTRMLDLPGRRLLVGVWRDITERKRAEQAIRENEAKYRQLFETAGDGIFLQDATGFIDCNEKGASMYGLSRAEVIGRSPADLAPERQPDGRLSAEVAGEKIMAVLSGEPQQFEWQPLRPDGVPLEVEITLNRIELGGSVCLQAVVRDITERKRVELQLIESELQYRTLADSGQALIWTAGTDKLCDYFNNVWLEFTGRSMEQEINQGWLESVHPDDYQHCRDMYLSFFDRHEKFGMDYRLRRHDGEYRWIRDEGCPRYNSEGEFIGYIGYCLDITERKAAEENLRITASVFDTSQEGILITDANNVIVDVNPAFTRITGYSREEVLGRNPNLLSSGHQDPAFYAEMWQALEQKKAWRGEIWSRRKSGEIYAELLSISVIYDANDGGVQRYVGVFSDISYLKEHEAELSRVAHYDALTDIPNRVLLADRMKQAIAQSARELNVLAVCYLDLDGFKSINDTLGHAAGDQVLVEVARRIGHTIRGGDTVARLGGDEFVVLLELDKGEECVTTLERLLEVIALPIMVKDKPQLLSASIGVSIYPLDNEDPDTLLRHADQAMYIAKQSGKNCFYIYDSALDQRARNHNDFLKSIRHGLEFNQFELYYQPKINLRTQRLVGAEALIRWKHPKRGLLSPIEFLRPIENTELDIEIGNWVIATSLAQINRWHCAGLDIEVSINISAYHLEAPDFVKKLQQQLAYYPDLPPGKLQIEILETAALNDLSVVCEIIEECRTFGVGFALDDFGTGYSSLSYLSKLPVDELKIDQSFVRDMLEDKGDKAIVQGIIALALAFDRQVVAEGIETTKQYQALLDMGCQTGQGYAIACPMPANELTNWKIGCLGSR